MEQHIEISGIYVVVDMHRVGMLDCLNFTVEKSFKVLYNTLEEQVDYTVVQSPRIPHPFFKSKIKLN